MEFEYRSSVVHNGVTFYVSAAGDLAYFVFGGTILSARRPDAPGGAPAVAKFGLALRGVSRRDRLAANYVRSELNRLDRRPLVPPSDEDVFVSHLGYLGPRARASEEELCGLFDLDVYDSYLTECMVSLPVASGIVLTTGAHHPDDRTLVLLDVPTIVNASSGFIYAPNRDCFALVQAHLDAPSGALGRIIDGLFDAVPATRPPLHDPAPPRHEVVVTAARAVPTRVVRSGDAGPPAQRGARISEFVQVKYILRQSAPVVWERGNGASSLNSVLLLCRVFRAVEPLLLADPWEGLDGALSDARDVVRNAVTAVFGRRRRKPMLGGTLAELGVSPYQRFALFQFLLAGWERLNCYGTLERLMHSYVAGRNLPHEVAPTDEQLVLGAANIVARELCLLCTVTEQLIRTRFPPAQPAAAEKALLLETTRVMTLANSRCRQRPLEALGAEELRGVESAVAGFLGALYARGANGATDAACAAVGAAWPVMVLLEVNDITAFDRTHAMRCASLYLERILTHRLDHGGVSLPEAHP
ncbi:tegument protein UL21 [Beluga whale alphaherpesvirus 1]|uniref:Tegument protein UL21 n=1 Tax=Beluga whale alphaherpesvirus 1 TaxID=1434720 RepID=A0A286MM60_9ALPH|nr:tegument protein UL21 [Beluga whale alphaherpesvirus 1]ASW27086.1 tegument protein UL21 [Beluga whale alphaherpesvirus 1]